MRSAAPNFLKGLPFHDAWWQIHDSLSMDTGPDMQEGCRTWWTALREYVETLSPACYTPMVPEDPEVLVGFANWLRTVGPTRYGPLSAPSTATAIGAIKTCYNRLCRLGLISQNPTWAIACKRSDRISGIRRRHMTLEDSKALLRSSERHKHHRILTPLLLVGSMGIDFADARDVRWGAYDGSALWIGGDVGAEPVYIYLEDLSIRVPSRNNSKPKAHPSGELLRNCLDALRAETSGSTPASYIFMPDRAKHLPSGEWFRMQLNEVADGVIPGFRYDLLRYVPMSGLDSGLLSCGGDLPPGVR